MIPRGARKEDTASNSYRKVLVIGAGKSGIDCVVDASKAGWEFFCTRT